MELYSMPVYSQQSYLANYQDVSQSYPVSDYTNASASVIISTARQCVKAVNEILRNCKVVGLDCEGVLLGKRGKLCLLQISTDNKTYIFDILRGGARLFTERGLRQLLESDKVIKVMHDCRRDNEALYHQYQVRLQGVFDTQVAYAVLSQFQGFKTPLPIGLNTLLRKFQCSENQHKDTIKAAMSEMSNFWETRPLTDVMVDYATSDVSSLLHVFDRMCMELNDASCNIDAQRLIMEYSGQYSELNLWRETRGSGADSAAVHVGYGIAQWDEDVGFGMRTAQCFSPFELYSKFQISNTIIEDGANRRRANSARRAAANQQAASYEPSYVSGQQAYPSTPYYESEQYDSSSGSAEEEEEEDSTFVYTYPHTVASPAAYCWHSGKTFFDTPPFLPALASSPIAVPPPRAMRVAA